MKVSFREFGGFVPIFRGCTLDTDALPAEEAGQLRQLVAQTGIATLRDCRLPERGDSRLVSISVEVDTGSHQVAFDAPLVPEAVQPLLTYLRARSRDLLSDSS